MMTEWKPFDSPTEDDPTEWCCFNCGSTSGFHTEHYPAGDADVVCDKCGSSNTGEEDDGFRSEECPVCPENGDENCPLCEGYGSVFPYQLKR